MYREPMIRQAQLLGGPLDGEEIDDFDGWDEARFDVSREAGVDRASLQAQADRLLISIEFVEPRTHAVYRRSSRRPDRFEFAGTETKFVPVVVEPRPHTA